MPGTSHPKANTMDDRDATIRYAVVRHGLAGDMQRMLDGTDDPPIRRAIVGGVEARDPDRALALAGQTTPCFGQQYLEVIARADLDDGDRRELGRVLAMQGLPLD